MSCHAGPFNRPSGTSHDRHSRHALGGERRLYVVAELSALLAMLANVADILLGFGGEIGDVRREAGERACSRRSGT